MNTPTNDFSKLLIEEVLERLKPLGLEKVVLFGSHADGFPGKDSDIDLYVVTGDDFMPQSFQEKMNVYLQVSNCITDIEKKNPIDLIVHTKPMHQKFNELGSMFSKTIKRGVVLYEKTVA